MVTELLHQSVDAWRKEQDSITENKARALAMPRHVRGNCVPASQQRSASQLETPGHVVRWHWKQFAAQNYNFHLCSQAGQQRADLMRFLWIYGIHRTRDLHRRAVPL